MLRSRLCDYSDAYILVKRTITLVGPGTTAAVIQADRNDIKVVFRNSAPFTDCITEINNTQADNTKDFEYNIFNTIAEPLYNSIKYSDNCSGTTGSLWQYHKDFLIM